MLMLRAAIDTNVIFEGLTRQGGACDLIVRAWLDKLFQPCVSVFMEYEYVEVLTRKLNRARWGRVSALLGTMLSQAELIRIYYSWRPASPDEDDNHVIDCAMNAGAIIVTMNLRDFNFAKKNLGVPVMSPQEFVVYLANEVD